MENFLLLNEINFGWSCLDRNDFNIEDYKLDLQMR